MVSKFERVSPYVVGIGTGVLYGITLRWLAAAGSGRQTRMELQVMSLSVFGIVPILIGFLAARAHATLSIWKAIFGGWVACILTIAASMLAGWEGSICIVMAAPAMLALTSIGGLIAWSIQRQRSNAITYSPLVLPFLLTPVEKQFEPPTSLRRVQTEIVIDATPAVVWAEIIRVRAIAADELRPSLASRLGFPRPIEATLDREAVGGVRHATFQGGVLFVETITDWEPERRLGFDIVADTASIPPTTLDEHVTIGGPYFDVLNSTYTIESRSAGGVILHLESELRVSTPFNVYAGPWADALMSSIQRSILEVLVKRCERRHG
jgi:hypothetical protein